MREGVRGLLRGLRQRCGSKEFDLVVAVECAATGQVGNEATHRIPWIGVGDNCMLYVSESSVVLSVETKLFTFWRHNNETSHHKFLRETGKYDPIGIGNSVLFHRVVMQVS